MAIEKVRLEPDAEIPMRDGCILKADIYYPDSDEPAPALLMRLPYAKELAETNVYLHPSWFAARGYIVVVQDVRGRGGSEGEFEPFLHEADDGYDTVEWVAGLPGCNGKVAMYGFSYVGATQLLAASRRPPHLACIVPAHASCDFYENWTYRGGALQWAFVAYWAYFLSMDTALRRGEITTAEQIITGLPTVGTNFPHLPTSAIPAFPHDLAPYFEEWLRHVTFDAYWQERGSRPDTVDWQTPAMHIAGWYDIFCDSTFDTFAAIRNKGVPQRLIVGPWWHMPWSPNLGIRDFGQEALSRASDWVLEWADTWCRPTTSESEQTRVDYFILGTNEWRSSTQWPPEQSSKAELFLSSNGSANSINGDGKLLVATEDGIEPDRFIHNPLDPVPSRGGRSCCFSFVSPMGPADQADVEARNDVLVYTSPPLTKPLCLTGPVELTLYASTSAEDTDFTAKLVHVDSKGKTINLCDGIVRASRRLGGDADYLKPGTVYEFRILIGQIAVHFEAGDFIRLEVASSNFPAFDRNPGGQIPAHEATLTDMHLATQTIYHSQDYPSRLTFFALNL